MRKLPIASAVNSWILRSLFHKSSEAEVLREFQEFEEHDYARTGSVASETVW